MEKLRAGGAALVLAFALAMGPAGCAGAAAQPPASPSPIRNTAAISPSVSPAPSPQHASPGLSPSPDPSPSPEPSPSAEPGIPRTDAERNARLEAAFEYEGLVDLAELDAGFFFDLRYATEDNFTGTVLYERPLCLARAELARALLEAQALADEAGLRLLIYDAYRPEAVQEKMYRLAPEGRKAYVAKPGKKANHTKGIAVDCALALPDGTPLDMPTGFDEFSSRAAVAYEGGTQAQRENRDLLISLMERAGLKPASGEWWHFAPPGAADYDVLGVSFEDYLNARENAEGAG